MSDTFPKRRYLARYVSSLCLALAACDSEPTKPVACPYGVTIDSAGYATYYTIDPHTKKRKKHREGPCEEGRDSLEH